MTTSTTRRRRSAYREAPHGRSSGALTKAPALAPLHSTGCFPLQIFIPSCVEKFSNISRRSPPDVMAVHKTAYKDSISDLPVRHSAVPACGHELPRCPHFECGDGRAHGLLPCRLMKPGVIRRVGGCG